MTNELPTVNIKGQKYVLVKDRVIFFNENCVYGSIETELISPIDSKTVVVKAVVIPDLANPSRRFVGHSQAVVGQGMVNTTSALENAETSAVGRALAMMGIGVIESIASADEVNKALNQENKEPVLDDTLTATCREHNVKMEQRISAKTGEPYWSHRTEDGSLCFGKKKVYK